MATKCYWRALSPAPGFETLAGMNCRSALFAAILLGSSVPSLDGAQIVKEFFALEMDPTTGRITTKPCCTTVSLISADVRASIEGAGQHLVLDYVIYVLLGAESDTLIDPPFLYYFDGFFSAAETKYFKVLGGTGQGVLRGHQESILEGRAEGEVISTWGYHSGFAPMVPPWQYVPFAYEFTYGQPFRVAVEGYLDFYSPRFTSNTVHMFTDATVSYLEINSITDLEGRPMAGAYIVDVTNEVPEPKAGHLAVAGLAMLFITRLVRRCGA